MPNISHARDLFLENPNPSRINISQCGISELDEIFDMIDEKRLEYLNVKSCGLAGTLDLRACSALNALVLQKNPSLENVILPEINDYFGPISISNTGIESLDFLAGVEQMLSLNFEKTPIKDISPLIGKYISILYLEPENYDLEPLSEIPAKVIYVSGKYEDWKDKIEPLVKRNGTTMEINYDDKKVQVRS